MKPKTVHTASGSEEKIVKLNMRATPRERNILKLVAMKRGVDMTTLLREYITSLETEAIEGGLPI